MCDGHSTCIHNDHSTHVHYDHWHACTMMIVHACSMTRDAVVVLVALIRFGGEMLYLRLQRRTSGARQHPHPHKICTRIIINDFEQSIKCM